MEIIIGIIIGFVLGALLAVHNENNRKKEITMGKCYDNPKYDKPHSDIQNTWEHIYNIEEKNNNQIKCYDKYNQLLSEGDYVDVQKDGVHLIYKKEDNQLYFTPYGKEDRVSSYFSNDMVKCDEVGIWITNDRYEEIDIEADKRMYTEEDMQNAFITGALTDSFNTWNISKEDMAKEKFEEWFKNFKKK